MEDLKGLISNPKNNKGYRKPTGRRAYRGSKVVSWSIGRCRICNRFLNKCQYDLCTKHQKERDVIQKSRDDKKYNLSIKGIQAAERRKTNPLRILYIKTRNYIIYNSDKLNVGDIF